MPAEHSKCPCEPAESGVRTPSNADGGRTEQNQRSGHHHEEKMLHHVCRQEVMIEVCKGRRNGNPQHADSEYYEYKLHGCTLDTSDSTFIFPQLTARC